MKKILIKRIIIFMLILFALYVVANNMLKELKLKSNISQLTREIEEYKTKNKILRQQIKEIKENLEYIEEKSRQYNMVKKGEKIIILLNKK